MKKRGHDALVLSALEYLDCRLYLACDPVLVSHLSQSQQIKFNFFTLGHSKAFHKKTTNKYLFSIPRTTGL